jgi:phosphopantothenoylcysteine decarboxylase / phosphopantothenate---cysteine ligase
LPGRALTPRPPWAGRRVVLGVTGGIAAYKAVQLARDLTRLGAGVDTILTRSAEEFVTPLAFQGVTGREVYRDLFSVEGAARHIVLGAHADLVLVAPATADLIARAAHGRADDLLTTTLLATRAPVLLAPAMNDRMWDHPQTRLNAKHLEEVLGYHLVGPTEGALAVGEGTGPGRMVEVDEITDHAGRLLGSDVRLRNRKVLVTAGPTQEAIDPVRYVGNRSSGRMGFALAREAWLRGGEVTLVTGPSSLPDPVGVEVVRIESAREMAAAVRDVIPSTDLNIFAAAVADYRPVDPSAQKIKRDQEGAAPTLSLVENPDVARETRELRQKGSVNVGFALETEEVRERARGKLADKGFDLIVANDPGEPGAGFEVETNRVTLIFRDGDEEEVPLAGKDRIAGIILDRVAERLLVPKAAP